MSIKVTSEVTTYDEPIKTSIRVLSHWCHHDRVIIEVGDCKATVLAADLKAAVDNATNKGKL
jgi:hypothetical protein